MLDILRFQRIRHRRSIPIQKLLIALHPIRIDVSLRLGRRQHQPGRQSHGVRHQKDVEDEDDGPVEAGDEWGADEEEDEDGDEGEAGDALGAGVQVAR